MRNKILYLGNFDYQNGFAALNRVIGNAVIFDECGYDTYIYSKNINSIKEQGFFKEHNITLINREPCSKFSSYFKYKHYIELIKKIKNLKIVVLYNFPAIPFKKILRYCKKHNIHVIADVTEWHDTKSCNLFLKPIKKIDTSCRMRHLNKKCDGLLVISNYLSSFYQSVASKLQIYPVMDYVLYEANKYGYKNYKTNKQTITLIGEQIDKKDSFKNLELLLKAKKDLEVNVITHKKNINLKNKNVHVFDNLTREEVYKVLSNTSFNYVLRKPTRSNNAGFPTKFAESMVLDIPVIYSIFSDLPILEKSFVFGVTKEEFLNDKENNIMIREEIKELFLSHHYKKEMDDFLTKVINKQN